MLDVRKQKRTSRLSVAISLVFHVVVIGALFVFAAREGMLGKQLKKIAVTMVPKEKEKPPEKPKEKPEEPKPIAEPPKTEPPKVAQATPSEPPKTIAAAPPPATAAPIAAPPPAEVPSFDFEGGKVVETVSDPKLLYKSYVEFTLRSRWNRPEGLSDSAYVAEAEVNIDPQGRLLGYDWRRGSGDASWDASVKKVLSETKVIARPPPKGFPERFLVRFDVETSSEINLQ